MGTSVSTICLHNVYEHSHTPGTPSYIILHHGCPGSCNHFHNILRIFDILANFLSPQVKRCAIITYKYGIYELPH